MSVCVVDVIFEIVYENVLFVIIVYLCFIYLKLKILYNVINIMKNYFMMLFFMWIMKGIICWFVGENIEDE